MAMLKVTSNKVGRIDVNAKLVGQWKSYKEWKKLAGKSFKFTLMNIDSFDECFSLRDIYMITEMQLAYLSATELCFETIRFNVSKLSRKVLVDFVNALAADEAHLNGEILEAWWD
jgi:hypothetical protein